MNNAPCNKTTGRCDNGCSDNWTGIFCEGKYNELNLNGNLFIYLNSGSLLLNLIRNVNR